MRKKGFTLVELLVVISIIALLMGILMPALARVRQIAYRMICGTNLAGIGKAMLVYSSDFDNRYPRAGGRRSVISPTGTITLWTAQTENSAFSGATGPGGGGQGQATISSSFYLLVKHADVQPRQFLCKGDDGMEVFELSLYQTPVGTMLEDVWDFGEQPGRHVSYAMHLPYAVPGSNFAMGNPISQMRNPQSPICSDKNPHLDGNASSQLQDNDLDNPTIVQDPDTQGDVGYDPDDKWNSACHQFEGQNVLYGDSHVTFESAPWVGIEQDNIWKHWMSEDPTLAERILGWGNWLDGGEPSSIPPQPVGEDNSNVPWSKDDAFLVNTVQQ